MTGLNIFVVGDVAVESIGAPASLRCIIDIADGYYSVRTHGLILHGRYRYMRKRKRRFQIVIEEALINLKAKNEWKSVRKTLPQCAKVGNRPQFEGTKYFI